jgi:hypothetical protein
MDNMIIIKKFFWLAVWGLLVIACKNDRDSYKRPFDIVPEDIPNYGILYVNHESNGRSGHGGNTITECTNGDIISFYSNVSTDSWDGHGVGGWSEYRRSTDGGKTWSAVHILDYSKEMWEGDEIHSALVTSVITAPNGTLIATLARFGNDRWVRVKTPVYLLSYDNGETWGKPREFDEAATVEDIAYSKDASFVYDEEVFIVFHGSSDQPYSLFVSDDNGESFRMRSRLPFERGWYYATCSILNKGEIIVYIYESPDQEYNLPYAISKDKGLTWSEIKTSHFAKRIRNPQMSDKIGDYYFLHGRSGMSGPDHGNLVLYWSEDGIHWNDGVYLNTSGGRSDSYSANEVIGKYDESKPNRLLIQSSILYDSLKAVNIHHWWIENIHGTKSKK